MIVVVIAFSVAIYLAGPIWTAKGIYGLGEFDLSFGLFFNWESLLACALVATAVLVSTFRAFRVRAVAPRLTPRLCVGVFLIGASLLVLPTVPWLAHRHLLIESAPLEAARDSFCNPREDAAYPCLEISEGDTEWEGESSDVSAAEDAAPGLLYQLFPFKRTLMFLWLGSNPTYSVNVERFCGEDSTLETVAGTSVFMGFRQGWGQSLEGDGYCAYSVLDGFALGDAARSARALVYWTPWARDDVGSRSDSRLRTMIALALALVGPLLLVLLPPRESALQPVTRRMVGELGFAALVIGIGVAVTFAAPLVSARGLVRMVGLVAALGTVVGAWTSVALSLRGSRYHPHLLIAWPAAVALTITLPMTPEIRAWLEWWDEQLPFALCLALGVAILPLLGRLGVRLNCLPR
jgi:hypothetical protein